MCPGLSDRRADASRDARREPNPRHLCRSQGRLVVPVLWRRLPGHLRSQGREGDLCRGARRSGQSQSTLRQGTIWVRLHPPPEPPDKAAGAAAGCQKDANDQVDPANPYTHFREASWEEALDIAAKGLVKIRDEKG